MEKPQAIKFWKALNDSDNVGDIVSKFENKKGYAGKRTLPGMAIIDIHHDAEDRGYAQLPQEPEALITGEHFKPVTDGTDHQVLYHAVAADTHTRPCHGDVICPVGVP
jgi:hypothetical protein